MGSCGSCGIFGSRLAIDGAAGGLESAGIAGIFGICGKFGIWGSLGIAPSFGMAGGFGGAGALAADGGAGTEEVEGAPVRNLGSDGEFGSCGIFGSAGSFGIRPGAAKPPSGGIFGSFGICGITGNGGLATLMTGAGGIVNCLPTTGMPSIVALPRSFACGGCGAGGANPDDGGGIGGGCNGAIGITVAVCAVWSSVTICCA